MEHNATYLYIMYKIGRHRKTYIKKTRFRENEEDTHYRFHDCRIAICYGSKWNKLSLQSVWLGHS